jgi:TolB protein
MLIDPDGSNERTVAPMPRGQEIENFSWSPNSRQILILRGREVLLIDPDGGNKRTIARMPRGHQIEDFSWSPDGRQLLLSVETAVLNENYDRWIDIYVVETDGGGPRRVKRTNVYTGHPLWSPRGDAILIDDNDDGSHAMWVVTLDGKARRLPPGPRFGNPAWSPDGTRIAYDGPYGMWIHVMNADGSAPRRVAKGRYPTWAPDEHIMFLVDEDPWVVNPDGSGPRPATKAERMFSSGEVSPDGRMVATSSSKVFRGHQDLFLTNLDGQSRKLSDNEKDDCCPVWSPDGKSLAFLRYDRPWTPQTNQGPGDIFIINADGSGERNLTDSPEDESPPDWVRRG